MVAQGFKKLQVARVPASGEVESDSIIPVSVAGVMLRMLTMAMYSFTYLLRLGS